MLLSSPPAKQSGLDPDSGSTPESAPTLDPPITATPPSSDQERVIVTVSQSLRYGSLRSPVCSREKIDEINHSPPQEKSRTGLVEKIV
ncbi:hypothetical protein AKJ44_00510 [candidate division MSBL1 archaeon SCGC-AAA261F17]|uniref:Uncharacterized protein n=1 Tax=candidate division MSBL1 archaeon SCGC-AAA261F17 TaxID=1698274 RepID=A0A133V7N0_9EURY|nr:hypothetical protein AKJ44_00510 [candidate division MSBL1 archaeon SCGC-AAA261F17]